MDIEIHIYNIKSQIVVYSPTRERIRFASTTTKNGSVIEHPIVNALDKELRYEVDVLISGRLTKAPVKRFSTRTYKFDTGCLSYVTKVLKTFQQPYKIVDKRIPVPPGVPLSLREGVSARPYQEEATLAALKAQRGVLRLATGAGKTFIAWNVLRQLNLPTVVFVHTVDLLDQFKEAGEFFLNTPVGKVGGGEVDIKQFTVVMMQTSVKAFDQKYVRYEVDPDEDQDESVNYTREQKLKIRNAIEQAQVVVADECHHLSCKTLQTLFKCSKNAFYRYGLTATMREDGADLLVYGVTGKVVSDVSASFLIESEPAYLVRPHIYYLKMKRVKGSNGNYHSRYKSDIVENEERNLAAIRSVMRLVKKGHRVLVLARQIKHLKLMRDMMAEGVDGEWEDIKDMDSSTIKYKLVTGAVNKKEREKIINETRNGEIECLFASTIADEGLDCPPISAVVLAGGGKSATKALQRVGRALRPYQDKQKAVIIDFYDQGKYFKKHTERRIELFSREPAFRIKIQK